MRLSNSMTQSFIPNVLNKQKLDQWSWGSYIDYIILYLFGNCKPAVTYCKVNWMSCKWNLKTDNKSDMNVDLLWVKPFRITVKRELCEYFSLNRVKIRMHSPYT